MKIVLVNHYAGGTQYGMEFRPHEMAKRWAALGNEVLVYASSYAHVRKKQPEGSFAEIDGVSYRWLFGNSYYGNSIMRVLNIMLFIMQLLLLSPYIAFVKRPDAVISSSTYTFDIIPCWLIARLSGAKLVYEVHDLWPKSLYEVGEMSKWHPFCLAVSLCEYISFRMSDKIVSMLPNVYLHAKEFGVKEGNYKFIPNGYDFSMAAEKLNDINIAEKIEANNKQGYLNIAYTGAIGEANAIDKMIAAGKLLKNEKVMFNIVGYGPKTEALKRSIKKLGLNINYFGVLDKKEVQSFISINDLAIICFKNLALYKYGIGANKIFDYMNAKKPVLLCCNTSNDPVSLSGAGFVVRDNTATGIAKAIKKIMQINPDELKKVGEKGYKYLHKNHNYDKLAEQFLSFLND